MWPTSVSRRSSRDRPATGRNGTTIPSIGKASSTAIKERSSVTTGRPTRKPFSPARISAGAPSKAGRILGGAMQDAPSALAPTRGAIAIAARPVVRAWAQEEGSAARADLPRRWVAAAERVAAAREAEDAGDEKWPAR